MKSEKKKKKRVYKRRCGSSSDGLKNFSDSRAICGLPPRAPDRDRTAWRRFFFYFLNSTTWPRRRKHISKCSVHKTCRHQRWRTTAAGWCENHSYILPLLFFFFSFSLKEFHIELLVKSCSQKSEEGNFYHKEKRRGNICVEGLYLTQGQHSACIIEVWCFNALPYLSVIQGCCSWLARLLDFFKNPAVLHDEPLLPFFCEKRVCIRGSHHKDVV